MRIRRCTVYHGHGEADVHSVELESQDEPAPHVRTAADHVPVSSVMHDDLVCARPDLEVASVVSLMVRNHVGCIPIVDERRHPIGVITKFDLAEQLDAFMRAASGGCSLPTDLAVRTADELMLPLALTLGADATVADAAAMMESEGLHHVLVVGTTGELVGVVSSKDVVDWLVATSVTA